MSALPFKDIFVKYVQWVSKNPQTTSEIESAVKWISYFVAGRISESAIISELVYSISNLVVLFNDNIIRQTQPLHTYGSADRLKTYLTVLEYSEVFIEVSAGHVWGPTGRWIIIALIQTFKCVARLALLYSYKEQIIQNPPVAPLRRSELNNSAIQPPAEGFALQSGRVIRKVDAAPQVAYRTWRPPELPNSALNGDEDAPLSFHQIVGEMLYVTKPLAHLATLGYYGQKDWRPFLLAFTMDLLSMQLLKAHPPEMAPMSRRQYLELSRRQVALLLYLLRSPFYEAQTRDRLNRLLLSASSSIPFVGMLFRSLAEYIPHWQRTYFYMWSA